MSAVLTIGISVTEHARHRVRKRLGIPSRAVERMAEKAWFEGRKLADMPAIIRRYIEGVDRGQGRDIRIHAGAVFIFNAGKLITAWRVPRDLHHDA